MVTHSIYAHSLNNVSPDRWHRLNDHLNGVAELAGEFASAFDSADWARAAGLLHDLGKAHPAFQAYLRRVNGLDASDRDDGEAPTTGSRINHSGAGAVQADRLWNTPATSLIGRVLAYLVAGHHAGLPDWYGGCDALPQRLRDEATIFEEISAVVAPFLENLPRRLSFPASAMACRGAEAIAFHSWVRMLFSCLVDADFLDTEGFMNPAQRALRHNLSDLKSLKRSFDAALSDFLARLSARPESEGVSPINRVRAAILEACRRAARRPPGFFRLAVPTGGGKTLSGTAFALDHAVYHGLRRIIYVIPYTSIIEQTAQVLRGFLGEANVVEHHSNVLLEGHPVRPELALAAENWDAPVIVTTNVQFFESLYAASPSRCRKLHNLVRSVIILDEAQLLPPRWLVPCVEALNRLVKDYHATVVFSTATQPPLPGLESQTQAIIEDESTLYENLRRADIQFPASLEPLPDWQPLVDRLQQHPQVLCIVNRRRDCYELYQQLSQIHPEGTIHLSALMCGAHRSQVIAQIRAALAEGRPVRVISTQLVEAGVDLDFPVVYRALAGLDSIQQAAGRCNREGRLPGRGQVRVFVPPTASPPGLLRKGEDATRELLSDPAFSPDDPQIMTRFFARWYDRANDLGQSWWHEHLVKNVNDRQVPGAVQFRAAAREFRLIDQDTVPIIVQYDGSHGLLERLRYGGPSRECLRALQRYVVNVHPQTARQLQEQGLVGEAIRGMLMQVDSTLYDSNIGLNIWRQPTKQMIW
ncbi:MAG: CRISPR-associated helicase Cas3 [Candidatus Ozemobacter sibiricus]|uniref:CRISPR-associated helicase Cas3 n=1 Tax=Candidatus Ozemobacter sibiricus TaxID=2268124 RepID=A0A367ZNW5_9BACT|nr:MAG: CRISPR-associated helicase Cas3 [Candidatus Ozemobacter sibiricus]